MRIRSAIAGAFTAVLLTAGCAPSTPSPASPDAAPGERLNPVIPLDTGEVRRVAVLGDSISVGFAACEGIRACPEASWASGTDPEVDSLADRLTQSTGAPVSVTNLAKPGTRISETVEAATRAAQTQPDLVTVLIGANDACASSVAEMTPIEDYRAAAKDILLRLQEGAPSAAILVVSVPDLTRLFEVGRQDRSATALWEEAGLCPSVLADPLSEDPEHERRRSLVAERIRAYNEAFAVACAEAPRCRTDEGSVADYPFERDDLSPLDAFHPSVDGQQIIARLAWEALTEER